MYLLIPLVHIPSSPFCTRSTVLNMFKLVHATPDGSAFIFPSKALTHQSFTSQLRTLLGLAGHNLTGYSGHSFWRGGASFTLASGVPGELIMTHGDWRSQSYLRDLDISVQQRALVSGIMAKVCIS